MGLGGETNLTQPPSLQCILRALYIWQKSIYTAKFVNKGNGLRDPYWITLQMGGGIGKKRHQEECLRE